MKVAVALMERQLGPCYECLVVNSVPNVVICRVYVLWFECNVYIMLRYFLVGVKFVFQQ
jgi:hypothetical protein